MASTNPPSQPLIGGNVYNKYHSRNPITRMLMTGFLRSFDELVDCTKARHAHEIGCGEGELTLRMWRRGISVRGCDASTEIIQQARSRAASSQANIPFRAASVYDLQPEDDSAELIVCCEVLEHLTQPEAALQLLSRLAKPYLIVSVPREPVWRVLNIVRAKYLGQLGNTPGHLQHWSARSFTRMLSKHVDIVELRHPFPWTMALCKT